MINRLMKLFNSASESLRSLGELGSLYAWTPWILRNTPPPADKRPVLVLPGFLTNDMLTAPLRDIIAQKGYDVHGWDGGVNLGFNPDTAAHLAARLQEVYKAAGNRKVALVGHSLGGVYARELARDYPEMVESVVTLGTPFGMDDRNVPDMLNRLYALLNPAGDPQELSDADKQKRRLTPPPVPATSIYSKADGVVPWKACLNPKAPRCENIEVDSSHMGMIYHPLALAAVLDRLAQPAAAWKPFDGAAYSPLYGAANENDLPANPRWQAGAASKPYFNRK